MAIGNPKDHTWYVSYRKQVSISNLINFGSIYTGHPRSVEIEKVGGSWKWSQVLCHVHSKGEVRTYLDGNDITITPSPSLPISLSSIERQRQRQIAFANLELDRSSAL